MKKLLFISLFASALFMNFSQESKNNITIGVSPPFVKNSNVNTIFFNRQFVFELLSSFQDNNYILEMLFPSPTENLVDYNNDCINEGFKIDVDYIAISKAYTINDLIFFEFSILNPFNNTVIFTKFYSGKISEYMGDLLSNIVENLSKEIKMLQLEKIKNKKLFIKKKDLDKTDNIVEDKTFYKHEIFFLNGVLKNSPKVMSFLNIYTGYNFTPFNFFSVEGAFFLGGGYKDDTFLFNSVKLNKLFVGSYLAFGFFIPGIVQPSVSLRIEFGYVANDLFFLSLPIDLGLKIFINKKNAIRINSSFQFNYFNLSDLFWEKNFIIGIMVGYAKKI